MAASDINASFSHGGWTAVLAALAFGAATPFVQRFGIGTGPFITAACLYLGAALG